jgi:hypothetical protein
MKLIRVLETPGWLSRALPARLSVSQCFRYFLTRHGGATTRRNYYIIPIIVGEVNTIHQHTVIEPIRLCLFSSDSPLLHCHSPSRALSVLR